MKFSSLQMEEDLKVTCSAGMRYNGEEDGELLLPSLDQHKEEGTVAPDRESKEEEESVLPQERKEEKEVILSPLREMKEVVIPPSLATAAGQGVGMAPPLTSVATKKEPASNQTKEKRCVGNPGLTSSQSSETAAEDILKQREKRCQELEEEIKRCRAECTKQQLQYTARIKLLEDKHCTNIAEVKTLLSSQKKVGERWKEEMMGLTSKFDTRLQDVLLQNKHLKAKVEQLQRELRTTEADSEDAKELAQIYKTRLTKTEKKMKQEMSREDESYIEITFPFSPL